METTTYIAITTPTGLRSDQHIVLIGATGQSRDDVYEAAARQIAGDQWDTAKDAFVSEQLDNLRVLPRSRVAQSLIDDYTDAD